MIVYTDSIEYAAKILPGEIDWQASDKTTLSPNLQLLAGNIFHDRARYQAEIKTAGIWQYLFIIEEAPSSHYDLMIKFGEENVDLPHGILCLAGSSGKLHGQRARPWVGLPGNIHLTVYFTPQQKIDQFGIGFTILSAVSVIETIDAIDGLSGRAGIKWVNDIFIDQAKVSGFLTNAQCLGDTITAAILGIGLNVEAAPEIAPDGFVPKAAALQDFLINPASGSPATVFDTLIGRLEANYELLVSGQYSQLLERYKDRSIIIGREVEIISDPLSGPSERLASGRVTAIGENLELYLEGKKKPITRGRLVLKD
ncbi:MAG: biotin--[acetyl-CoA-carboxylase] ligase [FCB group bacterium]|nr:biotin--[acetyl-CoA-carboxylase] ligase [FCB group bacterium]